MLTVWGGATSRTLRVHWMALELGLDYEPELIGPRTGQTQTDEFRRLNAKEKIPVLIDDDLVLSESVAIVTYLGDTYGPDSGLVPAPYSTQRARYNEWSLFIAMELDAHTLFVVRKHRELADIYGTAPAAVQTAIEGFNKQVRVAEQALVESDYLLGPTFSAADLILMTCLDWARAYKIQLSAGFDGYRERIRQRPAFKAAMTLNFSIAAGG